MVSVILLIFYIYPTCSTAYSMLRVSIGKAPAKVLLFSEISKKNAKKASKICIIQKKAVSLHAFSAVVCPRILIKN